MSIYKLTYFDLRVRGESPRMLFKLADQPFEDIRTSWDEWPDVELKKSESIIRILVNSSPGCPRPNIALQCRIVA